MEPLPRIRGENPPQELQELQQTVVRSHLIFAFYIGICILVIIPYFTSGFSLWPGIYFGLAFFGLVLVIWRSSAKEELHNVDPTTPAFVPLLAFNTEFTAVLADASTISTTVLFQIPTVRSGITDNLNRITEAILLRFARDRGTPPTPREIEDHLETALVQFQNENQIPVLRVQVITNAHTPAIKRRPDV